MTLRSLCVGEIGWMWKSRFFCNIFSSSSSQFNCVRCIISVYEIILAHKKINGEKEAPLIFIRKRNYFSMNVFLEKKKLWIPNEQSNSNNKKRSLWQAVNWMTLIHMLPLKTDKGCTFKRIEQINEQIVIQFLMH